MEGYAELYARQYRLRALGLRYFDVYGLREDASSPRADAVAQFLERIAARRPALIEGAGTQTRDLVHVEDAAAATVAALASDCCGVCNVGTGERTELRELARLVGHALDRRPLVHYAPARPRAIAHSWADTQRLRQQVGFDARRRLKAGISELASDWEARQRLARKVAARPPAPRAPEPRAARHL
jgi:UDP-glucose 4-epimerase